MPAAKPTASVPYTRIETKGPDVRVEAAGCLWAGVSEVPTSSLTPAQLEQLAKHEGLKVSEAEPRPAEGAAT